MSSPNFSKLLKAYSSYYGDTSPVPQEIERWENNEIDEIKPPPHGFLGNGMPLFQFLDISKTFEQGGTLVSESENCRAIIPAGFRKAPTFNTMNPVKFAIGGESALMCLCHVLVVPKNVRIYNAVTLKKTHIRLLSEMEELGATALKTLVEGTADVPGSIRWQLTQSGEIEMSDGPIKSVALEADDFAESCRDSFKGLSDGRFEQIQEESLGKMKFSFHLGDMASIGYLHMHCYLGNLLTHSHEVMEAKAEKQDLRKNTPLDDVIYMTNRIDAIQRDMESLPDNKMDSWATRTAAIKHVTTTH